jgi:hypothetical protein
MPIIFPKPYRSNLWMAPSSAALLGLLLSSCSPTVKLEAPDKPIVINLNVNITQEIRVKLDKDIDNLITSKKGLF